VHKRQGFTVAPEVNHYVNRLEICEHYRISWFEYDRLTQTDVDKAILYMEARHDAVAARKALSK
jgi:hypothetical protein